MNNSSFLGELQSVIDEARRLYNLYDKSHLSYKFLVANLSEIQNISDLIAESKRIRHFMVDSYDGDIKLESRVMELFIRYT